MKDKKDIYGLMAEFDNPQAIVDATRATYKAGYRKVDAYSPFPIEELSEALEFHPKVQYIVLCGGIIGGLLGYGLQYWTSAVDYAINIGGRPLNSWVSFIPITFELTVLIGAFSGAIGMLILNGLPQPYHPVFNVPRFSTASSDRFFLCIEAIDPKFDRRATAEFLKSLGALEVTEVEP
ncbi:MAG: DUF3341 domain-containing protein [Acidobacteria bacterium]|nr:DUF3341 domain-containing protein [Acidobacteriota bacterium]